MKNMITTDKFKEDFESVFDLARRTEGVRIKSGRDVYHLHREISEEDIIREIEASGQAVKQGKIKILNSLADLDDAKAN